MSTPFDAPYKEQQRALAAQARPRPLVSSDTIRTEGLELRRTPEGTALVRVRQRKMSDAEYGKHMDAALARVGNAPKAPSSLFCVRSP